MALIIALILVALAVILATKLSFDGWMERHRTIAILGTEQSLNYELGAEALAADVLVQDLQSSQQDTLTEAWAQPLSVPLTSDNDPEGPTIGSLQGVLEDMQGRFNLNNLARTTPDGKPDPQPLEQFQRLLGLIGVEPKWAGLARDWIDSDDQPGYPDGAEDAVYTAQSPPYRTANRPMMSPSELMNLPNFGAERYQKISPYVVALPSATSVINICTASAEVIESLADNLKGEFSANPNVLLQQRKRGCFPDTATLNNILGTVIAAKLANTFSDRSSYFRLTTRVTLRNSQFTFFTLLRRGSDGKVIPLIRSFGTL